MPEGSPYLWCLFLLITVIICTFLFLQTTVTKTASAEPQTGKQGDNNGNLVKDIVTIDSETRDISARLGVIESQKSALEERIDGVEAAVETSKQKLAKQRQALSVRVRKIYVTGRSSKLDLLFSSNDVSDFLRRSEFLNKVTTQDAKLIESVKAQSQDLGKLLSELKEKQKEIEQLAADYRSRQQRLTETRAEREKLLTLSGDRREEVVGQTESVETKMKELNPSEPPPSRHSGKYISMIATGYSPQEPGLDEHTATGMRATHGVVAVDPRVIPLGTRLYIDGYGYAIAGDTGSAIKGNRIDLCFDTLAEVESYGWRSVTVEILD